MLLALACGHAAPEKPKTPQAPPLDLVSGLTASGNEEPRGLTWKPGIAEKPAREVFKNVPLLGGLPAGRLMAGMQSMDTAVGARCETCHVEKDFKADDLPPKLAARKMLKMTWQLNHEFMKDAVGVTCYTCHRGQQKPPPAAFAGGTPAQPQVPLPALSEEQAKLPAEQVYKNIQRFKGVPAGKLARVMGFFTVGLGVPCSHCHVEGAWESEEKPAKQRAREMLALVGLTAKEYYAGNTPVNCGMCHRGQPRPARTAP